MNEYFNWPEFKDIYLEDSFVVDIVESDDQIIFCLEVILSEKHKHYHIPKQGEKYCYRRGLLKFQQLECVKWRSKKLGSKANNRNSGDIGNIDVFKREGDFYQLSGDWGEVYINSVKPVLELDT